MHELHWTTEEDIECPHCDVIHTISPQQFDEWQWCAGFGWAEKKTITCSDHQFTVACDWDKQFNIAVVETT